MSRHRRQRNKRFNRTINNVADGVLDSIQSYYDRHCGQLPRWATPIQVIAFKKVYRRIYFER